jgi:hypothetical protein
MGEGEQALHGGQLAMTRRRCELVEPVGVPLDVPEGQPMQRLASEREELASVSPVGPLGMAAAPVQPERQNLGVVVGLAGYEGLLGVEDGQVVSHMGSHMQDNQSYLP